jgi:aldose 1-epimerase
LSVEQVAAGTLPDGQRVDGFTLRSATGASATVLSLGATLQSLFVPDADGVLDNVTLGCRSVEEYLRQSAYLGAIVGRFANRIAGGRFTIDGCEYQVSCNEPPNSLHGGREGFDRRIWTAADLEEGERAGVVLALTSPDGDQGYPGTLDVRVRYLLSGNDLHVGYEAVADRATVVNLTSHAYWNLAGEGSGSIEDHRLWLNARRVTPVDAALIPTGALAEVAKTPLDFFAQPEPIGRRLHDADEQLLYGGGYDHNYVLERSDDVPRNSLQIAARVTEPKSGRSLEIWTTEPGIQFYSGNRLDGTIVGSRGTSYGQGDGFALEPQGFPDAPNQRRFPSTLLRPGTLLRSTSVYRFGA